MLAVTVAGLTQEFHQRRILELGKRISGADALAPHFNGSRVDVLAKGGLAGAIRQSSHSIGIARISIVKARKRAFRVVLRWRRIETADEPRRAEINLT